MPRRTLTHRRARGEGLSRDESDRAVRLDTVSVGRQSAVFDTQATAVATHFSARQLADLPSARSMWALQALAPGVRLGTVDVGGSAARAPGSPSACWKIAGLES